MSDEIKKLIMGVGEKIDAVQEKTTSLEKGYDGLRNEEIKSLEAKIEVEAQKAQDLKIQLDANEKSLNETIAKLSRPGISSSEKSQANEEYKSALREYYRKGRNQSTEENVSKASVKEFREFVEKEFAFESKENKEHIVKTLVTDSNPDGGYVVLPERLSSTVDRTFETSPMRALANVITTNTNSVEMIIDDNESVSGGWVSEQATRASTGTPQIGLLEIAAHEQYAEPLVSRKMLDDSSINVENWLSMKTNDILTRTENTAFISGDGVAKPKGVLSYDAWAVAGTYQRDAIEQINSGTAGQFTADALKEIQNSLKESYQSGASWLIKRSSWSDIIKFKDGGGAYLLDTTSMKDGDTMKLLGKPVYFADDMQAKATNALAMMYGNFKIGYTIVDRLGIRVLRDPFTAKQYVKFYTTKRVGGAVTNYESIKILKLAV